ncbi:MAG TPA: thiol-disulfide oxidoreductase DCC family protein [Flavobacterium sp.]
MQDLPQGKKIILFDGVCNLCNSFVNYVIDNDKKDLFRFAALQSEVGQMILHHIAVDAKKTDSIILYEPGVAYFHKSSAALEIASEIGGIFSLLGLFRFIPKALRDPVYDYIAKNRYKWYGKQESCRIPTPELHKKFL